MVEIVQTFVLFERCGIATLSEELAQVKWALYAVVCLEVITWERMWVKRIKRREIFQPIFKTLISLLIF